MSILKLALGALGVGAVGYGGYHVYKNHFGAVALPPMPSPAASLTQPSGAPAAQPVAPTVKPAAPAAYVPPAGTLGTLAVQKALNALKGAGTPLDEDGQNGPKTAAAVRAFQASHGLAVDGVVGPETSGALQAALAVQPSATAPGGVLSSILAAAAAATANLPSDPTFSDNAPKGAAKSQDVLA